MFENRVFRENEALGEIIEFISSQKRRHNKGKGRSYFYDEPGSRVNAGSPISLIAHL